MDSHHKVVVDLVVEQQDHLELMEETPGLVVEELNQQEVVVVVEVMEVQLYLQVR